MSNKMAEQIVIFPAYYGTRRIGSGRPRMQAACLNQASGEQQSLTVVAWGEN